MNSATASPDIIVKSLHADHQEVTQSKHETTKTQIPKREAISIKGKHLAKRSVFEKLGYGDPRNWDTEFEETVLEAVNLIRTTNLGSPDLIEYFEKRRNEIAVKRQNLKSVLFGVKRDDFTQLIKVEFARFSFTSLRRGCPYGYALNRAIELPYDGNNYIEEISDEGKAWVENYCPDSKSFRYGLVQGNIEGIKIPLTQYIFAPMGINNNCFGEAENDYLLTEEVLQSAIWIHPGQEIIPRCMEHIFELVEKGLGGDLTTVPKIHWWYVHLAPCWRGSGGIAEMLTNTICRLHDIDLPPWKDGIAPSVEILLEPNEERFCENYHHLFDTDQEMLKSFFSSDRPL